VRSVNCNLHDLLSILRFLYVFFSYFLNFWFSSFPDGKRLGNQLNGWSRDSRVSSLAQGHWPVRIAHFLYPL
jgi:hypothetical protein